jgi:hypothetical protein
MPGCRPVETPLIAASTPFEFARIAKPPELFVALMTEPVAPELAVAVIAGNAPAVPPAVSPAIAETPAESVSMT